MPNCSARETDGASIRLIKNHWINAKGKPSPNATKIWLTCTGQCVVANNDSRIPQSDLKELLDVISAQFFMICRKWKEHFCVEEIQFFC